MLSYNLIKNGKPATDSLLYDKVYMTAHMVYSGNYNYRILIDKQYTPTVRFDDTIPVESPTREDMKQDLVYSMFSSNAMLNIIGLGYPITLRGKDAYSFSNHYTCPAGRCDMLPRDTAMAELNEEILIFVKNRISGELRTLGFGSETIANKAKTHKEKEHATSLPPLLMLDLNWLEGKHSYSVELGNYTDAWESISECTTLESGSCTVIKDDLLNTYELCFTLTANLGDEWIIETICDGERYHNKVILMKDLHKLPIDRCVPALKGFIKTHSR